MCDLELDKASFDVQWDVDCDSPFADALEDMKEMHADGLVLFKARR
jgi:hypothetical protein